MRDAMAEILVVLAHSTRTQLALLFGLAFFLGTMAAGYYFASHMELHGLLAPLSDVIREKIASRYDKVAWAILFSFLVLAIRCYQKDRKRLFGL
jgi:uncharacterized membrane protein